MRRHPKEVEAALFLRIDIQSLLTYSVMHAKMSAISQLCTVAVSVAVFRGIEISFFIVLRNPYFLPVLSVRFVFVLLLLFFAYFCFVFVFAAKNGKHQTVFIA